MTTGELKYFFIILALGEMFATALYFTISKILHHNTTNKLTTRSLLKGLLERAFLLLSLINGFPQALTVFGALKIATRLKDKDDRITNDYFLIGNMISLMLAIIYFLIWKNL